MKEEKTTNEATQLRGNSQGFPPTRQFFNRGTYMMIRTQEFYPGHAWFIVELQENPAGANGYATQKVGEPLGPFGLPDSYNKAAKWGSLIINDDENTYFMFIGHDKKVYLDYVLDGGNLGRGWTAGGKLDPDNEFSGKNFRKTSMGLGNSSLIQAVLLDDDTQHPYLIYQNEHLHWKFICDLTVEYPNLPSTFVDAQLMRGNDNNLQCILLSEAGDPYLIWQNQEGQWFYYGELPKGTGNDNVVFTEMFLGQSNGTLQLILWDGNEIIQPIVQQPNGVWGSVPAFNIGPFLDMNIVHMTIFDFPGPINAVNQGSPELIIYCTNPSYNWIYTYEIGADGWYMRRKEAWTPPSE